jgi:RES domain-containing protein
VPQGRRARDVDLLDDIDACPRHPFHGTLWRVTRAGRDPLQGGPSASRWCNGSFDVLYTSLERDGAVAELYALLSMQPVMPSKIAFHAHRLTVSIEQALHLADFASLKALGVDVDRYKERDYGRTQEIADAAYFLGFDGLIAPSARWSCANAILFTDRIATLLLILDASEATPIDWRAWRAST